MVSAMSSHYNHAVSYEDDREYNVQLKMTILRSERRTDSPKSSQNKLIDTSLGASSLETFHPVFTGYPLVSAL